MPADAPYAVLSSAAAYEAGQAPATVASAWHKAQMQIQRALGDQFTPLRLAGHLSVLAVAAVILLLSQVKIPDWNLPLESLPNNILAGQLQSSTTNASTRLFTAELGQETGNFESLQRIALPFTVIPERPREALETYIVQAGDTILGIAAKYGLQPETIIWANPEIERSPDRISIGDQVKILPINGVLHVVKSGDTISSLATRYKVETTAITGYKGNNLNGDAAALVVGGEIIVPGGQKPTAAQQVVTTYTAAVPASAARGSGAFLWPTSGSITQKYWSGHAAIDIGSWMGAPVKASDGGYVVQAGGGWNSGYGNHVVIDHGNGYRTLYAHMTSVFVSPGENVTKGQQIGTVGNTGNSTGPHLHFEVLYQGVRRNPYSYLP
ncbi:MAG: peptidoglycan DD-metalloendopeptidase family protein [Caldilineaceae bacterium]|nr:peptidoglycan DD-metalloendopeptidase family protein [Caldilineaceae bacterium]